eukprot:4164681-Pleurochrysis_carterae.AAC.4
MHYICSICLSHPLIGRKHPLWGHYNAYRCFEVHLHSNVHQRPQNWTLWLRDGRCLSYRWRLGGSGWISSRQKSRSVLTGCWLRGDCMSTCCATEGR